jgi:pimeloyl-ACP methyl ester carboxylesterase
MAEASVNGLKLYYEIRGAGPDLLLISGLGTDSQTWTPVLDGLSGHFRVLTFDNRGAGRSDTPDTSYTIADMAADARRMLGHLGIGRAHLLGHSMGGYIAQEFALEYPECVDRLILADTAPVSSERNNIFFKDFLGWWEKGMDLEDRLRHWSFWLFSPERFRAADFMENYIRAAVANPYQQSVTGFRGQVEAIASFDARDRLHQVRAETLIIEGKEDILILPREAETLKKIRGSSLLYIEEAAHLLYVERPEAFSRAVLEFLKG